MGLFMCLIFALPYLNVLSYHLPHTTWLDLAGVFLFCHDTAGYGLYRDLLLQLHVDFPHSCLYSLGSTRFPISGHLLHDLSFSFPTLFSVKLLLNKGHHCKSTPPKKKNNMQTHDLKIHETRT